MPASTDMTPTKRSIEITLDDIEQLAIWALEEHQLDRRGWVFRWDRAVRRVGNCSYRHQRITLSRPIFSIAANRSQALDVILHEVAHVLAGSGAGHGPVWRSVAASIGAPTNRLAEVELPASTWLLRCFECGSTSSKTRRPRTDAAPSCPTCGGMLQVGIRL